jgi:hypothetical protein
MIAYCKGNVTAAPINAKSMIKSLMDTDWPGTVSEIETGISETLDYF